MKPIFASLLLAATACSHNPLDPGAGNSAGHGTSTLTVNGEATAHPRLSNASKATDFDTDFSVRVTLNNQPVTTGTVTMMSSLVNVALTFNTNGNGRWEGTAAGYDEVYRMDVISGADNVEGVIVDGPDIHVFTAPTAGASMDSTIANTMTWNRGEAADSAEFGISDTQLAIPDSGTYSIPPSTLRAEKDQSRPNTLRLTRTNRVTPSGAAGGSEMSVSVDQELDVVALPNPLL